MSGASGSSGSEYQGTTTLPPPAPPPPPPQRSLPIGVAILAILIGLYGFILFLGGLLLFVHDTLPSFLGGTPTFGLKGVELAAIVTIVGLIILGIGVALWRLRLWALVLALLFLLYEIIAFAYAREFVHFGFILAVILFVYLLAVNRHFR